METIRIILQLVVALSLVNVWLIQPNKATKWRGGESKTIMEEFKVYGLPQWFFYTIGFLKLTLSIMLIFSIWYPILLQPAALGLAILLLGSISMHFKIKDPLYKSFPAALFFIFCLVIAFM